MFEECKQFGYFILFALIFRKRVRCDKVRKRQKPNEIKGFKV